jgi:hypothetical protein
MHVCACVQYSNAHRSRHAHKQHNRIVCTHAHNTFSKHATHIHTAHKYRVHMHGHTHMHRAHVLHCICNSCTRNMTHSPTLNAHTQRAKTKHILLIHFTDMHTNSRGCTALPLINHCCTITAGGQLGANLGNLGTGLRQGQEGGGGGAQHLMYRISCVHWQFAPLRTDKSSHTLASRHHEHVADLKIVIRCVFTPTLKSRKVSLVRWTKTQVGANVK